jgi:hypothetical protein
MLDLQVDENCALLGYYTASSNNFLLMIRDNILVPSSRVNPKKKASHCSTEFIQGREWQWLVLGSVVSASRFDASGWEGGSIIISVMITLPPSYPCY